jgi:hypothetical protein
VVLVFFALTLQLNFSFLMMKFVLFVLKRGRDGEMER